jgi:hypothetical protein
MEHGHSELGAKLPWSARLHTGAGTTAAGRDFLTTRKLYRSEFSF